jgi:hypothetical protein
MIWDPEITYSGSRGHRDTGSWTRNIGSQRSNHIRLDFTSSHTPRLDL